VELELFDQVAETLRGVLPAALGEWKCRAHRYGIKVWFGSDRPGREHYEAQVIGARHVEGAEVLALEIGFHTEHPKPADNDAVIDRLTQAERRWRKRLGAEAEVGPFLGRPDDWRRVSETWPDPDLSDPELAVDVALRLADYVTALEPVRTAPRRR
jgi:hypothetical protein